LFCFYSKRFCFIKALFLDENKITNIHGLENLQKLEDLSLKGNPLNNDLIKKLGGLNYSGSAKNPQRFVEYCKKEKKYYWKIVLLESSCSV